MHGKLYDDPDLAKYQATEANSARWLERSKQFLNVLL